MKQDKKSTPPDRGTTSPAKFSPLDAAIGAMQPLLQSSQIAIQQQISGPLPAAEMLRQYE
jgi:hypothetical protein